MSLRIAATLIVYKTKVLACGVDQRVSVVRLHIAEVCRRIQMDYFPVAFILSVVELQGKKWILP